MPLPTVAPGEPLVLEGVVELSTIASDRFNTITVKEVDGRWAVRDADDVTLYSYTTETAARHKAEQVRQWGRKEAS